MSLLKLAAEVAAGAACDLYWVGGGVRDLWLGTSAPDLDLVVEGDLEQFARRLAAGLSSDLRFHPKFLTAELLSAGGVRIDVARARSESYSAPASLPVVAPGTMAGDFKRRDFTINCLAIPLAPGFGESLIDPCGGRWDLDQGLLRTLHSASFRDDPTRILRGLEFAARFGFRLTPATWAEAEIAIASGDLQLLSPARLGAALRRGWNRPADTSAVLRAMGDLELLGAVEASLRGKASRIASLFEDAVAEDPGRRLGETFRLILLLLSLELEPEARQRLTHRLALTHTEAEMVELGPRRIRAATSALPERVRPSTVHACLAALSDEELAVVAASDAMAREWVRREGAEFRALRLAVTGRDLISAGLSTGPAVGRALELTLQARLDGVIGPEGELEFALRAARQAAAREDS